MIDNFPKKPLYNPGGYRSFLFIPRDLVSAYPLVVDSKAIFPLGFLAQATWLNGYGTSETLQLTEDPETSIQGTFYNPTLTGFLPGDTSAQITLMENMEQDSFLVLATDNKGIKRLLGTLGNPLIFSAKFDSAAARAGAKGFSFQFAGQTLLRAPVYPF